MAEGRFNHVEPNQNGFHMNNCFIWDNGWLNMVVLYEILAFYLDVFGTLEPSKRVAIRTSRKQNPGVRKPA